MSSKKDLFKGVESPESLAANPDVALKPCFLCEGVSVKRLYMQEHFPVVRCKGCGLIYADEHFQQVDLETFYSGDYYQRAYVCHPPEIDEKVAADYVRAFEETDKSLKGGRLLDFGSARGTFLGALKDRGFSDRWQLEGVDINPDEVAMGQEAGRKVFCGEVSDPRFEDASYDAVTAFSVLEHLQKPDDVMRDLHRVLRPGGELVAIVPSGRCLILDLAVMASKVIGGPARGFTDNVFHEEHLYYFTRESMTRALRLTGFEPKSWFYLPSYLETHPPGLLVPIGAFGLRLASWALRKQTMMGFVAVRQ